MTPDYTHNELTVKMAVVVAYFGRLPTYFNLFAHTCRFNPMIDWHIFTDQSVAHSIPKNVIIHPMTFDQFVSRLQQKIQCSVCMPGPYKICDFKPTFGVVFEDELKPYAFWGFGDIDVIMGRVDRFLNDKLLSTFDKIFDLGHLSFFRNCERMNRLFMTPVPGQDFRDVLTVPANQIFDEGIKMRQRLDYCRIPYYGKWIPADISPSQLALTVTLDYVNYRPQIFIWKSGSVYRLWLHRNQVQYDEFGYIHLQKRKMAAPAFEVDSDLGQFIITPQGFLPLPSDIPAPEEWPKLNPDSTWFRAKTMLQRPWKRFQRARQARKF